MFKGLGSEVQGSGSSAWFVVGGWSISPIEGLEMTNSN